MDKEEFYRAIDKLFGVDTYREQLPYRRRWGQRNRGNGRYPGRGVVWWYGCSLVRVILRNPKLDQVFHDPVEAVKAIERLLKDVNDMKHYLVTFDRDWADEFSVYGFTIMTETERANLLELVAEHGSEDVSAWFGTNEGWDDTIDDLFSSFEFVEISLEEKSVLEKLFPGLTSEYSFMKSFGYVPDLISEAIEDGIIEPDVVE